MLKGVSVLIPYKPDYGIRDKSFQWVKSFYEIEMPEVELIIGYSDSQPFNRSEAINNAAKKATRDIFVIADADVIYNPRILIQSLELLKTHPWVIPFSQWLDISKLSTEKLLTESPQWPLPMNIEYRKRHNSMNYKPVSGVIVLPREKFYTVEGFDERFKGWGREDNAFSDAMNTLCGPYKRIEENYIFHLWHPKVGPKRNPNMKNNNKLYKRYAQRKGKVEAMKELIKECKEKENDEN
ncbi:galactosyltransferase-related protein [Pseudalkalibacillus caeni]|uniref:Glycosyltransferase n=1 Tax=Exobacillus caeni TaxID=2574798 RepID=A0A5R9FA93_9BACL|nr:galactosyltransferase-related protein [Pseudalkalibacillus caeni]TLS37484.1 glycosyltransferase [Pseudalkalibacillus caeni]